jgi:hypothetical protein
MMELNETPGFPPTANAARPCSCQHSKWPHRGVWYRSGRHIVIELGPQPRQAPAGRTGAQPEFEAFEFSPEFEGELLGEGSSGESGW